jgi:hypothetical protein
MIIIINYLRKSMQKSFNVGSRKKVEIFRIGSYGEVLVHVADSVTDAAKYIGLYRTYIYTYLNKEICVPNSKYILRTQKKQDKKLIKFVVIQKLMMYSTEKNRYKSAAIRRQLKSYNAEVLRKALEIFEDENSNVYNFKDFTIFDNIKL